MQPHEKLILDLLLEANGRIRFEDLCSRVKSRMFKGSARTAGVVKMVDKALKSFLGEGLVEQPSDGTFTLTPKGHRAVS